jgi:hypothetical protein
MSVMPALAAEADFYTNDATGEYGTTVSVPINISSTPHIGATDILLTYDPSVLTAIGVDAGALTSGVLVITDDTIDPIDGTISEEDNSTVWSNGALASNATTSDTVNISIISSHGISGAESIATVQFYVKGGYDATSPLTLSAVGAYDLDDPIVDGTTGKTTGYAEISVTSASGVFTATGVITGDINVDQKVDYKDLGMLGASYGLSLGDSGYNAAADLNGDGIVNYKDLGMLGAHYGEVC